MQFSSIALGLWRIADGAGMSPQGVLRLVETALDHGISTLDQADIYGNYSSETLFGKALSLNPALRAQIQLVTKCGIKLMSDRRPEHEIKSYDTSREHVIWSVENSLREMQTDYIDLLLIHRPDPLMDAEALAETFLDLHQSGKVRYFGVSNFTPAQTDLLQSRFGLPLVSNQIEINPLHLAPFTDGSLDHMYRLGIVPMAWSPFGGGQLFTAQDERSKAIRAVANVLAEKYALDGLDQVILAWLLLHPAGIVPVLGTTKPERVEQAAKALAIEMEREDWFKLYTAALGQEVP